MSQNLALVQNGSVHTDYESVLTAVNWCTPALMGFSVCVNASAAGGMVILQLTLNSPMGSFTKTFNVNTNTCFSWNLPLGAVSPSVEICVANLNIGANISFALQINLCLNLPFIGRKCAGFSHNFNLPALQQPMLRASNPSQEDLSTLLLLLTHSIADQDKSCNCH